MKKNKLKETIEFVGLSYKKELTIVLIVNIIFFVGVILIYIFFKNIIYSVFVLVAIAVLDYFMFSRYNDKKKTILKNRENELVSIISYFDVYIRNNKNVYQSFNQLIPYCSNWMKEKVEDLRGVRMYVVISDEKKFIISNTFLVGKRNIHNPWDEEHNN